MQRTPNTPVGRVLQAEGRKQSWLAMRLGVAEVQVWRWVHGIHDPSVETKVAIAAALGRSVEELFPAHDADSPAAIGAPTNSIGRRAA